MKRMLVAVAAMVAAIASPALAASNPAPVSTINLSGSVAEICGVFNTSVAQNGVINVPFNDLTNIPVSQTLEQSLDLVYLCNDADGFSRTISSENRGALARVGSGGILPGNRIGYTVQHNGGIFLAVPQRPLLVDVNDNLPGSRDFRLGQAAQLTLRINGVQIQSPTDAALTTTDVFAGDYTDVISITITAR